MIKTSAKTTSILAVAIAVILALCAVSGAVIYNSSSNNNTTDSGDIPVSPIRPIDDPEKVTTLPSSSSDLVTMLSKSTEDGNALLVDRLANNNYTFNGATYSITSSSDVAKYLYSLGYTVAGNNLAADIVGLTAQETTVLNNDDSMISDVELAKMKAAAENYIGYNSDDSSYVYSMSIVKENSSDVDDSLAAIKKKKSRTFSEATEIASSFSSLKDLTVKQFTSGSWLTDVENRALAYNMYFMEFADKEIAVLDAMIGTPFSLDGKVIRSVTDAESLAQMFYETGYEVVGSSLVDNSLSFFANGSALATTSNFKLADANGYALMYKAPVFVSYATVDAIAPISGPFYDLNDMTIELFIGTNFMMNEIKKAQVSSDLEISNELTNTSSQKASVVAQYISFRCSEIVVLGSESGFDSIVALDLVLGTPFVNEDSKIAVITDLSTLADFFESAGVVVKDNRAVYCSYSEDVNGVMVSASLNGMKAQLAYEILAQKNCISRCISLEDIENAMETLAEAKKKAAEAKAAETADSESQAGAIEVEGVYISDKASLYTVLKGENCDSLMIYALNGYSYINDCNEYVLLDDVDSIRTMMALYGFEFTDDGQLLLEGVYAFDLSALSVGNMVDLMDKFCAVPATDYADVPVADETPREEVAKAEVEEEQVVSYNFVSPDELLSYFNDIENQSILVSEALQGTSFKDIPVTSTDDAVNCMSVFFGDGYFAHIYVDEFLKMIEDKTSTCE